MNERPGFYSIDDKGYMRTLRRLNRTENTFVCTNDHSKENEHARKAFRDFFLSRHLDSTEFERG